MYINRYAVVQETDLQRLQDKVNRLATEGYFISNAYGIPDYRPHSHVVWMCRNELIEEKECQNNNLKPC